MKKSVQTLTLLIGCLLAMVIICSQLFHYNVSAYSKNELKSSKKELTSGQQESDQSSSEETVISLPSFSLPSPIHVSHNFDGYCLFEILFETSEESSVSFDAPLHPEKLFVALFRFIIAPNAP
jgi:hypothetical protein